MDWTFYHLAAFTGARRGELLALRWSQVDLREGTVALSASTDVIDGERVTDTPKSGRSRTIGIDPRTVTVLLEHRLQQHEERARLGASWVDAGGYLFTREDGRQLYPGTVTQLMSRSVRDYNQPCQPGRRGSPRKALPPPEILLPPARLHDLRHLHATGGLEPPIPCLQVIGDEFRCVSTPFIPCCLSTDSGSVAVARYRSMLGKRAQSALTDAPTGSGLKGVRGTLHRSVHVRRSCRVGCYGWCAQRSDPQSGDSPNTAYNGAR